MIVKTAARGTGQGVLVPEAMIAVTLGDGAKAEPGKSPGTRAKAVALLRAELVKAQEYVRDTRKDKERNLRLEALGRVIAREKPLLVTAHRAHDIITAIRIAREFNIRIVLDGAAEVHQVLDAVKASGFPVIVHPTMQRTSGEAENLSRETAAMLAKVGIPFAMQSGFESYVPKTRVVLFEAGVAAANGLGSEPALRALTIGAARMLGIDARVGTLEPGKDADLALFDGDPLEYTSHVTGVVIDGEVVSRRSM